MFKSGWDHVALAALKKMKHLPLPADISAGERIFHRPTGIGYVFGDWAGDEEIIAVSDSGEAFVLLSKDCYSQWNPNRDPQLYENILLQERKRTNKRGNESTHDR